MNPFLRQPLALQRTPLRAERPEPRNDGNGVVALRLYDPIDDWGGPWGTSAKEFVAVLDELPDDTTEILLLINSPGGVVTEGLAVLNALRAHPARVVAVVEGIAASSASFIAAGVDELQVMANAELFVHNAWGLCVGNAADMERMARDLAHADRNIASIYAAKAGGTVDEWLAEMAEERTYSAQEAVDAGLADRVVEPNGDGAAKARARFDLSALSRAGRQTPAASADGRSRHGRSRAVAFSDEQLSTMRQQLGLAADADEATIVAAQTEALAERAAPTPGLPEGVVAVDAAVLAELRSKAQLGEDAHARQQREDREALVTAAVKDGRIAPASREGWLKALKEDRGTGARDSLASLQPGLIPVGPEVGHSADPAAASDDPDQRIQRGRDLYSKRHGKTA